MGGRPTYRGTGLKIWQVVQAARDYKGDAAQAAAHLSVSPVQVMAALNYARAFAKEIGTAIGDRSVTKLEQLTSSIEVVNAVPPSA